MITEPVIAVSTMLNHQKVYVYWMSRRFDGKLIPVYTNDSNLAHDFGEEERAQKMVGLFVNPNHYEYTVENIDALTGRKILLVSDGALGHKVTDEGK